MDSSVVIQSSNLGQFGSSSERRTHHRLEQQAKPVDGKLLRNSLSKETHLKSGTYRCSSDDRANTSQLIGNLFRAAFLCAAHLFFCPAAIFALASALRRRRFR